VVTGGRDDGEGPGAGRFQNQMRVAVVVVSFPPFLSRPLGHHATGLPPRFGSDAVASGVGRGGDREASRGHPTSRNKRRLTCSCQRLVHGSAAESIERLRLGHPRQGQQPRRGVPQNPPRAPPLLSVGKPRRRARLSGVPARRARVLRHRPSSLGQRSRDSRGKGPTAHDGRQATTSASQMQILPSGLTDRYRPLAIHRWCWFNPRSMASLDEAFAFSTSTRRCGTSKLKVVLTAQRLVDT